VTALGVNQVEEGYQFVRMAQVFVWARENGHELVIDSDVGLGQPNSEKSHLIKNTKPMSITLTVLNT